MHVDNYDTIIVKKPWGHEYLVYKNDQIAIWFLYIKNNFSTSLHCHPKKTTGLVLLDGKVEISFFNDTYKLNPGHKMMIRKGLFHSTKSTCESGSFVFEVETPVDKHDLVRFKDNHGREGKPYEDHNFEVPKTEDCLTILEPTFNETNVYNFCNCSLIVKNVTDSSYFLTIDDELNIVFIKGGITTDFGQFVASPGDVVVSSTIKKLIEVFPKVSLDTIIMIIKYNG
jgi:mannose-6-phosphate isomerase-like protein (cupin superfamily)